MNNAMLKPVVADYSPKGTIMKEKKPPQKIATFLVLVALVLASLTFAYAVGHRQVNLTAIDAGNTLVPTGVNTSLNVTFSDLTFITQPPQMGIFRGGYNLSADHPSFTVAKGTEITNGSGGSTYQTLYHDGATYTAANFSQAAYNFSKDKGSEAYAFSEARLAYNGTSTESYNYVLSAEAQSGLPTSSSTTTSGNAVNMTWINIAPGTGTATLNYYKVGAGTGGSGYRNATSASFTDKNGFNGKLHNLTFYLYSMYITTNKTDTFVNASISNTANGTILATSSVTMAKEYLNYSKLNVTSFQASMEKKYSGFMMDWMYVATHSTYSSSTAAVSPALQADSSLSPMVSGSASFVNTGSSYAPFDPTATNDTQYQQAPNLTAIHVNTNVGSKDFTGGVLASNNSTVLHALLLNTSYAKANFKAGNQSLNSTSGFQTFATTQQNNNVVNANIHISVWNSTGIHSAIMSFLKNYSAVKATVDTGILTNYTDITIMGYTIGSVQLSTNLTKGDASAVRNYFDNGAAATLKATNLSLVDTNTTAIVAGAFAGDFYFQGQAYAPQIEGNEIIDPATGAVFASVQAAGFAQGAFIAGGAVIVPTFVIAGFSGGLPVFSSQGFSFGSLFGGLTSAGSAVGNWLSNGGSSISNAIGSATHTATNYVVKPITSSASNAVTAAMDHFNSFRSDIGNLSNTIMPAIGAIPGDIKNEVSSSLGPIAGAVSKVSSQLGSFKQGLITSVASGYSGMKTQIYELGNSTSNSIASLKNTLGKYVSQDQAAISSLYTAMANIPGEIKTDTTSLAAGFYNASKTDMSTLLNTAGAYYTGLTDKYINATQSAYGAISSKIVGLGSTIRSGAGSAWSMITSFGAKVGYILEIAGITIVVVAIIAIILYVLYKKSPEGQVVEGASKL